MRDASDTLAAAPVHRWADDEGGRGNLAPTIRRRWAGIDHKPPRSRRNNGGSYWRGTSRVLDPAARRKANRLSWNKLKAQGRRDAIRRKAIDFAVLEAHVVKLEGRAAEEQMLRDIANAALAPKAET